MGCFICVLDSFESPTEVLLPLLSSNKYLVVKFYGEMLLSKGIASDMQIIYLKPQGAYGGYSLSIYEGKHPRVRRDMELDIFTHKIGSKDIEGRVYRGEMDEVYATIRHVFDDRNTLEFLFSFRENSDVESIKSRLPNFEILTLSGSGE